MPLISTARESLERLNHRIAGLQDPQQKAWLTTYRDHWWGEVVNDVDAVIATMSHGAIRYTFDGNPFMTADSRILEVRDRAATRAMYDGVVALGVRMAGPVDDERVFFNDEGLVFTCILSAIYPGIFLTTYNEAIDLDGVYLVRWPSITMVRFDADGLMKGEDIMNGAPILVQVVNRSMIYNLVDGPIILG